MKNAPIVTLPLYVREHRRTSLLKPLSLPNCIFLAIEQKWYQRSADSNRDVKHMPDNLTKEQRSYCMS